MPKSFNDHPNCRICDTASDFLLNKDGFDLYCCPSCFLVFVWPDPSLEFLSQKIYSAESGYQSNKTGNPGLIRNTAKTKELFKTINELAKGKKFLDIGCSSGEFMLLAQEKGFQTTGVELNRRTFEVAKAHGLNVINVPIENANFLPKSFNVIFMGDVIEHVSDPKKLIDKCFELLDESGLLVIITPNLSAFWPKVTFRLYKMFGIPWSSVTPPYHLSQFSDSNLKLLVSSRGLKFVRSWFYRPPRLAYELGSLHLLKRYKSSRRIVDLVFMIFAFAIYTFMYMIDLLITPLKSKDFSMIHYYVKPN